VTIFLFQALMALYVGLVVLMAARHRGARALIVLMAGLLILSLTLNVPRIYPGLRAVDSAMRNGAAGILFGLAALDTKRLVRVIRSPMFAGAMVVLGISVVSAIDNWTLAVNPDRMMDALRTCATGIALLVALGTLLSEEAMLRDVALLLALCLLMVAFSGVTDRYIGALYTDLESVSIEVDRVRGLRGQANGLAYFSAYGVPLFEAMRRLSERRSHRIFWLGAIVTAGLCVLLTQSRAGAIVYALALLFTFGRRGAGKTLIPVVTAALGFLVLSRPDRLMGLLTGTGLPIVQRFQTLLQGSASADQSVQIRAEVLRTSLEHWSRSQWLGVGPWQFPEISAYNAHNTWAQVLVELGAIGLTLYVVFLLVSLLSFVGTSMQSERTTGVRELNRAFGGMALLNIAASSFSNGMFDLLFFVFLGVGMAIRLAPRTSLLPWWPDPAGMATQASNVQHAPHLNGPGIGRP
jgi:hypothetical protein